jgi:3-deoxy-D-manno-octulosonic-acid transferase
MHLLYSIALGILLGLTLPLWLYGMLRHGKYRAGLSARLGSVPATLKATGAMEKCIWIHAVSVGEVLAVAPLIAKIRQRFEGIRIVVSTTTMTGQALAQKRFGEQDVFYFPLDFAFALRPYFERLRPSLVVIAETEFWPNFLRLARANGARIAVVNARISDRSFPRYRALRSLLTSILANVDVFLAQSELDRERLLQIGAPQPRVQVGGNLKFDAAVPAENTLSTAVRSAMPPNSKVWVCGSTVEGEEAILLDAFQALVKDHHELVMVLAPRHPERFQEVADLLVKRAVRFWRRSAWNGASVSEGVFLLDTIGELAGTYRIADFAFVGGSLAPRGGHNILEPALFGVPTMVGPHTENFRDIVNLFEREQAVQRVDEISLKAQLNSWLKDSAAAKAMGERAQQVCRAQSGAVEQTLTALEVLMWMPETIRGRYQQVQR